MFDQSNAIGTETSGETSGPAWARLHGEMKAATRRRIAIEGRAPTEIRFAWKHRAHVGSNEPHDEGASEERAGARFGDAAMRTQARDALIGLGWKPGIARTAVDEACARVGTHVRIEELIAEALRRCPRPLG